MIHRREGRTLSYPVAIDLKVFQDLAWPLHKAAVAATARFASGGSRVMRTGTARLPTLAPLSTSALIVQALTAISAIGSRWRAAHTILGVGPAQPRVHEGLAESPVHGIGLLRRRLIMSVHPENVEQQPSDHRDGVGIAEAPRRCWGLFPSDGVSRRHRVGDRATVSAQRRVVTVGYCLTWESGPGSGNGHSRNRGVTARL